MNARAAARTTSSPLDEEDAPLSLGLDPMTLFHKRRWSAHTLSASSIVALPASSIDCTFILCSLIIRIMQQQHQFVMRQPTSVAIDMMDPVKQLRDHQQSTTASIRSTTTQSSVGYMLSSNASKIILYFFMNKAIPDYLAAKLYLRIQAIVWIGLTVCVGLVLGSSYNIRRSPSMAIVGMCFCSVLVAIFAFIRRFNVFDEPDQHKLQSRTVIIGNIIGAVLSIPLGANNLLVNGGAAFPSFWCLPAVQLMVVLMTGSLYSAAFWTLVAVGQSLALGFLWSTSYRWSNFISSPLYSASRRERDILSGHMYASCFLHILFFLCSRAFLWQMRGYHNLLKSRNEDLELANEQTKEALRTQREFVANMSHEFRTPLTHILAFAELLWETEMNADQREMLSTVISSARTMLALVNDVLDISKMKAHKLELERIQLKLRTLVFDVIRSASLSAHEARVEMVAIIDPKIPDVVLGDPVRIRQILLNLCGNAVKFTSSGQVIVYIDLIDEDDYQEHLALQSSSEGNKTTSSSGHHQTAKPQHGSNHHYRFRRANGGDGGDHLHSSRSSAAERAGSHGNISSLMARIHSLMYPASISSHRPRSGSKYEFSNASRGGFSRLRTSGILGTRRSRVVSSQTASAGASELLAPSHAAEVEHQGRGEATSAVDHYPCQPRAILQFRVEDSGIGMNAEEMNCIFDEFKQAQGSTTRKFGGTGLGLSISRTLVHMMGGDLTAQSEAKSRKRSIQHSSVLFEPGTSLPLVRSVSGKLAHHKAAADATDSTSSPPGSLSRQTQQDTLKTESWPGPASNHQRSLSSGHGSRITRSSRRPRLLALTPPPSPSGHTVRIAIFDDNKFALRMIGDVVKRIGGTIVPPQIPGGDPNDPQGFADPDAFLKFLCQDGLSSGVGLDMVIVDVGLVGYTGDSSFYGWQLINQIREMSNASKRLPVLALSDHLATEPPPFDIKDKAQRIVTLIKPVSEKQLALAIRTLAFPSDGLESESEESSFSATAALYSPGRSKPMVSVSRRKVMAEQTFRNSSALHVLVVDDNAINLKVMSRMLCSLGHTCMTTLSGEAALDMLSKTNYFVDDSSEEREQSRSHLQPFIAVLSDIMMPGIDGYELSRRIQKLNAEHISISGMKSLPVFAVTAAATEEVRKASFEAGMCGIITKAHYFITNYSRQPYTRHDVVAILSEVPRLAQMRNQSI